jgi:replicative DNA helicase
MHEPTEETKLANITAEFQMLGAIMSDNAILERTPFLKPEHFFSAPHERIFRAIHHAWRQGQLANALTLKNHFATDADLADVGGATYLADAMAHAWRVMAPVELAEHLVGLAQRRALREACEKAVAALEAVDSGSPAEAAVALAKQFEDVSRGFNGPVLLDDFEVAEQILNDLRRTTRPTPTGLRKLDAAMDGGLYPGKAYGFAARKKVGKSILACTLSANLNELGVKHLFVCGEMSPKELHQRTLSRLTDTYPSAFRSDYGQSVEFQRKLADAVTRSKRCTLYYNAPALTFDELRRVVVTAVLQKRVKGIILDYWQLVGGKDGRKSTAEHLDEVAQWIADAGRKYGFWSVVMAQINQEGNTRGGEGMRLAFDQVYHLRPCGPGDHGDITNPGRWLEMLDTRYTAWANIGAADQPGLLMNAKGPYFEQA